MRLAMSFCVVTPPCSLKFHCLTHVLVPAAGPLPWDLLSESSEEELTPRQARRTVDNAEEEDEDATHPEANGIAKAPAPEAAGVATKGMSLADQIAFGTKGVKGIFQVNSLST